MAKEEENHLGVHTQRYIPGIHIIHSLFKFFENKLLKLLYGTWWSKNFEKDVVFYSKSKI